MSRTRIVLVDDHEVVRLGLRTLLNDELDLQVVGEAGTAADAVALVDRLKPDIVLLDVRIPGEGGIEAARQITQQTPATKIIMLTSFADDDLIVSAIRAGVMGYVLKQVGNEELLRAIRAVLGNSIQWSVQKAILERHHGELPVGSALIVPTEHKRWRYLVVAPTMRIPESVANTVNAYLAFRAALLAVRDHNALHPASPIRSVLVPGMATGVGGMAPGRCANQMRTAYDEVSQPARIPNTSTILDAHAKLRSGL